ncbi:polysaccharide biosynthesis protein [Mesorhizobium sp. M7A.F.Ca.AU.002.06.1.1]|uniref:Polysaccharide biosynthesis protein CapD n=5 Tax=Phyllobacteriaceae TaxID=69277 RepID=E8TNR8_MESCW|nr:polysaccharide biosynthesis protein CapD [Mesorhizobium ciceri biovar biserrulae WSM1271]ARP66635.1 lipopolysaccharide biosynthesis protein [Mesorhizobium sp. WSM1497]RUU18398.1 polysaccharide biosynthesis protein [Mesorhizobium sp. Primo-B]RUU36331.1 polysaccharide biosynthesis protein [Mesorhizobium sp. Primo-A]RUX16533.1 polysaccharide biosynthesis protein [Mesorhizobium sp. M7A.F.Ca.CA.002.14.1.2]RUX41198.1 polysaccharide biosynthesis protein [Mesorhizobium sp. M7A.F.Ca.CA.002.11.2.1]R
MRRAFIMVQDVVMVLVAVALSLILSRSNLSFEAFSNEGLATWAGIVVISHLLFRYSGLYTTVWRFASTPDFFNILKSCAILTFTLYMASLLLRFYRPVAGLNERQFIVFFLVSFTIISAPRLFYRFLRDGASWGILSRKTDQQAKRALFVGRLGEADLIIRFTRTAQPADYSIAGIMATERGAPLGTRIQGVPVVATMPRLIDVLEDYATGTKSLDLLIFGSGAEHEIEDYSELVRIARHGDINVVQFSGLSELEQHGKLVLDTVEMETILRRPTVASDIQRIGAFVGGKRVLVTGGAGSIGQTLVRRSLELGAEAVLVADNSEFGIFQLSQYVDEKDHDRLKVRIVDVADRRQITRVVTEFRPDIIFHAAALKHVPLLEENWDSAIQTNIFGTLVCAEVAAKCGVAQFVLISSDKAVDPSSVLGMTKRAAEQIISALHGTPAGETSGRRPATKFIAVRFGNVFGSNGSVATIFQAQIEAGGPVTITDRRMTRYFMTVAEAVDLVIMSAADAASRQSGDDYAVYMLDMGKPVPILEVAETMIRLSGKSPYKDVAIRFTGIRPGEKLHETLHGEDEELVELGISKIFGLSTDVVEWSDVQVALTALQQSAKNQDKAAALAALAGLDRAKKARASARQDAIPKTAGQAT